MMFLAGVTFIVALFVAVALADTQCPPGTFYWMRNGISRCAVCQPGCFCPGGYTPCGGCSGGFYTPYNSSSTCITCPPGTTSDYIFNAGCDPENFLTPCSNDNGPIGQTRCRPDPPPKTVQFAAPDGALDLPPQYLTDAPPYVPNVVPPYYDIDRRPFLQQSY